MAKKKIKDKKDNLKKIKRKVITYIQRNSQNGSISWLFNKNFADQEGVAQYIQSDKRKKRPTTKNTLYLS